LILALFQTGRLVLRANNIIPQQVLPVVLTASLQPLRQTT